MRRFFAKYKFFGIVLLTLSAIIITVMFMVLKPKKILPVYQPNDIAPELVDSTLQHVKKYHTVADFKLTNQNGKTITEKDYEDKIYVADFFFTTCKTSAL